MKFYITISISLIALLSALTSCRSHKSEAERAPLISDTILHQLRLVPVEEVTDSGTVALNGKVQPDETRQAKLYALVSGRIVSVHAELGDYVKKGQTLAVLRSTEVAGNTADLSSAENNLELARKNLETVKDLYNGKLATGQDLTNAQITFNKAESDLRRAKDVAAITGGAQSVYTVISPINGYVIEKNITASSEVRADNNTDLFAVADLSAVWVIASVYESDMSKIHEGDPVQISTLADPGRVYPGKIDKIYNMLDPSTRTMKIRVSLQNPDLALKPEMFATIRVSAPQKEKVLSVPLTALVMDQGKDFVIVSKNGNPVIREVKLIRRLDQQAIVTGVQAGESVVTNYPLFVYQALTNQ